MRTSDCLPHQVRAVPSVRAAHARHVQQRVLSARGAAPAAIVPRAPRCAAPHRHHSMFAPHRRVQQPWSEVLDLSVGYQGREARPPLAEANLTEQLEVGILCDLRFWARACPEAQLAHLRLFGERLGLSPRLSPRFAPSAARSAPTSPSWAPRPPCRAPYRPRPSDFSSTGCAASRPARRLRPRESTVTEGTVVSTRMQSDFVRCVINKVTLFKNRASRAACAPARTTTRNYTVVSRDTLSRPRAPFHLSRPVVPPPQIRILSLL
jgi:hypothetical protein